MRRRQTILEVLFPQVRAEILRLLFMPPHKERYVRELMGMSGLSLSTVQQELRRLTALRMLRNRSNGYYRFYRADRSHPLFANLVSIVLISERSPGIDPAAVQRQRKPRPRPKPHHLRPDRAIHWGIFSKEKQT